MASDFTYKAEFFKMPKCLVGSLWKSVELSEQRKVCKPNWYGSPGKWLLPAGPGNKSIEPTKAKLNFDLANTSINLMFLISLCSMPFVGWWFLSSKGLLGPFLFWSLFLPSLHSEEVCLSSTTLYITMYM